MKLERIGIATAARAFDQFKEPNVDARPDNLVTTRKRKPESIPAELFFRIHAFMQHSDDFYMIGINHAIEDQVIANLVFLVSSPY